MSVSIMLYTDGACSGNPGAGGYAAILVARDKHGNLKKKRVISGGEPYTTNNRMELRAVIEGLKMLKRPSDVTVVSDSQYVVFTMTKGWKRKANHDLWEALDALCAEHRVTWEYIKGHSGHPYNEECDRIAVSESCKFTD